MTSVNDELDDIAIKNDARQGELILKAVYEFLGRFVVYPSEHARVAHVLWIAHTHLMAAWESTPRIAFLSPEPASGKTRSMEVSELLVPDPVAAVNVTPAYLFRKCGSGDAPPTILFDEIDTVFGAKAKEHEELRALLNSGHRRGAKAGRCVVRGKIVETEEISSYSAVALAGLGWLPDTILSRSIIVRMRRRVRTEKVEPFRRRVHAPQGESLRHRLAGWAAGFVDEATQARPEMPAGVEDRAADMWEPLFALADIAGGQWPQRAREAAVALVAVAREVEPSLNLRLLADLRTVFGKHHDALHTKTILAELHKLEDAPWDDIKGKPLSDNQLARRLRNYDVKPKDIRIDDVVLKGYRRADLHDAWRRYLPPLSEEGATGATGATDQPFQGAGRSAPESEPATDHPEARHEEADVAATADNVAGRSGINDARNPHEMGVVAGVAGVAPFPGNGGDRPGLSWRAIDRLARDAEDWAHASDTPVESDELAAEIRRRLTEAGIFPEAIEIETDRVMRCLFETEEARRHRAASH